jgi:hypothetical protein
MAEDNGAVGIDKIAPGRNATAVTEHDTTELNPYPRALYIGGAGNLVVDMLGGQKDVAFNNVPAGTTLPITVKRVKTASTVSDIVAIW